MKKLILILVVGFSSQSFAFDKEDSSLSFQDALFASNKDYNTHKKQALDQENERIDQWGDREVQTLVIKEGIQVEARDYNRKLEATEEKFSEFKIEDENKSNVIHEVSMND